MDLTSLSWDSFMSFFIFCSVTFFPCNTHYMKQREFSLLDLLSPAIWKQKNNVKDYTSPAIWSRPQETSLLFLRVITRWLLHEGTLKWGSTLLGAKIWKLHIRDSLKNKKVHNTEVYKNHITKMSRKIIRKHQASEKTPNYCSIYMNPMLCISSL